jgi:hypothetical protein
MSGKGDVHSKHGFVFDFNIFTPIVCPHVPRKRSPLMGDRRGAKVSGRYGAEPRHQKILKSF